MRVGIAGAAGYTAGELIRILTVTPEQNSDIFRVNPTRDCRYIKYIKICCIPGLFSRISIFQTLTYSFSVWDMGCRENF